MHIVLVISSFFFEWIIVIKFALKKAKIVPRLIIIGCFPRKNTTFSHKISKIFADVKKKL